MVNKDLAVIVVSCDKYFDVWKPFFDMFFKYWLDCPYNIYLGTNELDFKYNRVKVVKCGPDESWAGNYKKLLESVKEKYVLTFLDDFFLSRKVETGLIEDIINIVEEEDVKCYRLYPRPKGQEPFKQYPNILTIKSSDRYCVNTQISIWDKETLKGLLKEGYSAWDFEFKNSATYNNGIELPGNFVSHNKYVFTILNGVYQGKWVPQSLRYCKKAGVAVYMRDRKKMSWYDVLLLDMKLYGSSIFPQNIKRAIKRLLFRIGFKKLFISID